MDIFELGSAIRSARLNMGISQAKLCDAVSMARPTLSLLENGKLPEVGIRKVMDILAQLGMELTLCESHGRPTLRDLQRESAKLKEITQQSKRQRAPRKPRSEVIK
jgi:HTH-type transcriptional regulator/antitoxin HipB